MTLGENALYEQEMEIIQGVISAVVYQNYDNGYAVLRLVEETGELMTVVGCIPCVAPGERLTVSGTWESHPQHGEQLKALDVERAILNLGGNVQTVGAKPDGSPWRVAVQDPRDESTNLGVLIVKDTAVVTSGDYQRYFIEDGVRYCHILDPRTGKTVNNGVCSVTILCQDGLMADCLSTAMMVLGKEEAFAYWSAWGGFEMLVVTNDGTVTMTPGFNAVFETNNDLTYTVEVFGEE